MQCWSDYLGGYALRAHDRRRPGEAAQWGESLTPSLQSADQRRRCDAPTLLRNAGVARAYRWNFCFARSSIVSSLDRERKSFMPRDEVVMIQL